MTSGMKGYLKVETLRLKGEESPKKISFKKIFKGFLSRAKAQQEISH
jgi:hypothetical protein